LNIAVCIKQVPDVPAIRVDQQRMTIIREGVESIINPLDRVALEAAMALREKEGGKVTAITMGPPQSEEALREAIAVGADEAVLLTDPAFSGADTLATSHVIARAVSMMEPFPELIVCGMQTIDSDTGHVGPQIAEELNLPQVSNVTEILMEGGRLTVKRVSDGFIETIRVSLPALISVTSDICGVSDLALGAVEEAFSGNNVRSLNIEDLGLKEDEVGLKGSVTRVRKLSTPAQRREGDMLEGKPDELLKGLMEKLEALSILDEEDGKG
jgi:electron transfer flavoprotein beta subunit